MNRTTKRKKNRRQEQKQSCKSKEKRLKSAKNKRTKESSEFLHGIRKIINDFKKQRNILPRIAWITYGVALCIAICFVIRTFWPKQISIPESINITVVDPNGKGKELSPEGKVYLKDQLHTALMETSKNAEVFYNEKFATLLTILTIFGIAWPIVVGLLQFRFNEREIIKIQNAEEQVKKISSSINDYESNIGRLDAEVRGLLQSTNDTFSVQVDIQVDRAQIQNMLKLTQRDIALLFQANASFFEAEADEAKSAKDNDSFIRSSILALEMGMNAIYYFCLLDDENKVNRLIKTACQHLDEINDFMSKNNKTKKYRLVHLKEDMMDVLQKHIDAKKFAEMQSIISARFSQIGDKKDE